MRGVLFAAPRMFGHGSEKRCHGADGFHQETVHRHHRVDRGWRRRPGLAFPDGRPRNPERRLADGARVADGGVRQRGQGRRRVRPGPLHPHHRDAAGPHLPAELGQAVQEPVQERRLLLQHPPADRPALGHDPAGDDPRQGLRRGAPARLRQLRLPHRRSAPVLHRDLGHARAVHGVRPRRPAARPDAAAHLGCGRRQRHALPRPRRQPGRVRQRAAGSHRRRRSPSSA